MIENGIRALPVIFTSNYFTIGNVKADYRPMAKATFAIEYELFGSNPKVSHLVNLLIYAFSCLIVFSFLFLLFKEPWLPFLTTLLFIAHPIHTEVVNNLKNRDELLAFLFGILCLFYTLLYFNEKSIRLLTLGLSAFILGLFSKMTIVTFIPLLILFLYFFQIGKAKSRWLVSGIFATIALVFYIFIFNSFDIFREFLYVESPIHFEEDVLKKTASIFLSMGFYLKLLFFPHPLSFYYGYNIPAIVGWKNIGAVFSFLAYLAIIIFAVLKFRKQNIPALSILVFFLSLIPVSNLITPYPGIIGERSLYIPSLGFCLFLGWFLIRILKVKSGDSRIKLSRIPLFAFSVLLIFSLYSFKTISRNSHWKSRLTLYENDIKHLENSAKANQLYAFELRNNYLKLPPGKERDKMINLAVKHFQKSVDIYDNWALTHNYLGLVYARDINEPLLAIPYFKRACDLKPNYLKPHFNLARCFLITNRADSAAKYFQESIRIDSSNFTSYNELMHYYEHKNDLENLKSITKKMMEIFPGSDVAFGHYGNALLAEGDSTNAMKVFEKAVELNPKNIHLLWMLSTYYLQQGDTVKAEYMRQIALENK